MNRPTKVFRSSVIGSRSLLPTLGGMQFWADQLYFRGYRIQRHFSKDIHRLLAPTNHRIVTGSWEVCEASLNAIRMKTGLTADTGHAVIYLHGIGRTSRSMQPIICQMPTSGWVHIPFEYPSTRVSLESAAASLDSVIRSLEHVERISFVVHSMGGLVVRQYLSTSREERLGRLIMMGTPNHGAEMADLLRRNLFFRLILGPAGQQLVTGSAGGIVDQLPVPRLPFGIIAGGRGDDRGFNPLIPGDDDGTVTVKSTQLPGASDFLIVKRLHMYLMTDPKVILAVKNFLEHGRFVAAEDAAPELSS